MGKLPKIFKNNSHREDSMVSEIPKKIYKALIGLIALSLSLTSVFGTLSAVAIFSNPANIQAGTPEEYPTDTFNMPVQIYNAGFYDIEDVEVSLMLRIYNTTDNAILMNKSFPLPNFPAFVTTSRNVTFKDSDLNHDIGYWDPFSLATKFNATITIDLYYMFKLMHFTASFNQTLTNLGDFLS
jgi:hypothetical protein